MSQDPSMPETRSSGMRTPYRRRSGSSPVCAVRGRCYREATMDPDSLRLSIRRDGETCDPCDAILSKEQLLTPSVSRPLFPGLGSRRARHLAIAAGLSQRLPRRALDREPRRLLPR